MGVAEWVWLWNALKEEQALGAQVPVLAETAGPVTDVGFTPWVGGGH